MHFAMPPRKTSRPPPYVARNQNSLAIPPALKNLLRRDKARWIALALLAFLGLTWLFRRGGRVTSTQGGGWSDAHIPKVAVGSGSPVVIVTVLDPSQDPAWTAQIKANREDYAKRHGYKTFFPSNKQYPLKDSPLSWSRVPAMRHAMTLYPGSTFFWYLDATALIMTPSIAIHNQLLTGSRLESLMLPDAPIVPPNGVIRTFSNVRGDWIDLVITQDKDGLAPSNFILRNGEWAKFFLDSWFDPIYRSYNFQKAESHALEHIVQWHGTVLAKIGIIPQRLLNAYAPSLTTDAKGEFKEGDLVANFPGCDLPERNCLREQRLYLKVLEDARAQHS